MNKQREVEEDDKDNRKAPQAGRSLGGGKTKGKAAKIPISSRGKKTMLQLVEQCRFKAIMPDLQPGSDSDFESLVLVNEPYDLAEVAAFFYDPPPVRREQTQEYWSAKMVAAGVFVYRAERGDASIQMSCWKS